MQVIAIIIIVVNMTIAVIIASVDVMGVRTIVVVGLL